MNFTTEFIFASIIVILMVDAFLLIKGIKNKVGTELTISHQIFKYTVLENHLWGRVILLAAGFLLGHFFG